MTVFAELATGTVAIFLRDFRIWKSYKLRWITTIFSALASVTLFYYVSRLVSSEAVGDPDDYFAFVVVGTVILGVLTSTLTLPVASLRADLIAGTFERMVASPLGPRAAIAAMTLFPIVEALAVGALTIAFAALAFGLELNGFTSLLTLPVALLGLAAFMPFGLAMGALALTFKGTNAGAVFVITGLSLVAGIYFPTTLLPDWIQWTKDVQPFTPALDLMRGTLNGAPVPGSDLLALIKLAGFALVVTPGAAYLLGLAVERGRRTGTITEP